MDYFSKTCGECGHWQKDKVTMDNIGANQGRCRHSLHLATVLGRQGPGVMPCYIALESKNEACSHFTPKPSPIISG